MRRAQTRAQRARTRTQRVKRPWVFVGACLVSILSAAACAMGSWFVLHDASTPPGPVNTTPAPSNEPADDLLASRETDPQPVTVDEFFNTKTITAGDNEYTVVTSEDTTTCAETVTDELVEIVNNSGCTEVTRATLTSTDDTHVATVGVMNLADTEAAETIHSFISNEGGGFTALRGEGPSKDIGLSPTILGYRTHGHYVLYVIVGRIDAQVPSSDDPNVTTLVNDFVDNYLVEQLNNRVSD